MNRFLVHIGVVFTVITAVFTVINWLVGNYTVAMLDLGVSLFCGIVTFAVSRNIK